MLIKYLENCEEFVAGDDTLFRELLHPEKEDLKIHYSLGHATLKPGRVSKPHKLKSSEAYYILEGEGEMYIDDENAIVHPGQAIYIPPNTKQYIKNIGTADLKFLCIVDPAWQPEDEEIL